MGSVLRWADPSALYSRLCPKRCEPQAQHTKQAFFSFWVLTVCTFLVNCPLQLEFVRLRFFFPSGAAVFTQTLCVNFVVAILLSFVKEFLS